MADLTTPASTASTPTTASCSTSASPATPPDASSNTAPARPGGATSPASTSSTTPPGEDALAAERAAILNEHPTHNVVHNRNATRTTTPAKETTIVEPTRLAPLQVGDWAALGLSDGTCPVGQIVAVDEHGLAVQLVSFFSGYLMDRVQVVLWPLLVKAEAQYPEFAETDDRGAHVVNLDPLADFQSSWRPPEETP